MTMLQLTFAILKPHVVKNPVALSFIRQIILEADFKVVRSKRYKFSLEDAGNFYEEHRNKFFFNRLATFMTSGPSDLYILAKHDAIKEWRKLMGPTKIPIAESSAPESIRGQFGLTDTRNAAHGSDSPESAAREIRIMFPDFDIDCWYANEEPFFRANNIKFLENDFLHHILYSQIEQQS